MEARPWFAPLLMRIHPESLHLEYLTPMGAKNSPAYLSSLMQIVLKSLPIQHVLSYLDDILVADTNMEDHLKHLNLVLGALVRAGLKLNPAKCAVARDSVVCLGHHLSRDGISPDPANVEKIKSWKPPTSVKKLRTFLGLTGYYRQYVKNYSDIANCLTDLTREKSKWVWLDPHQKAFERLRTELMSAPIMAYPNFSLPFTMMRPSPPSVTSSPKLWMGKNASSPAALRSSTINSAIGRHTTASILHSLLRSAPTPTTCVTTDLW